MSAEKLAQDVYNSITHNGPKWRQPKCPATDEELNQMWCSHVIENCLVTKRLKMLNIL